MRECSITEGRASLYYSYSAFCITLILDSCKNCKLEAFMSLDMRVASICAGAEAREGATASRVCVALSAQIDSKWCI